MPRLLIYEECLAAYQPGPIGNLTQDFLAEGLAMVLGVAEDFARLRDWQVRVLRSVELIGTTPSQVSWTWVDVNASIEDFLARDAQAADVTLVIAPECGGLLEQRASEVVTAGGKLLGPSPEWIQLASNKTAVLNRLQASGIRTPRGYYDSSFFEHRFNYPVVLKPNDGAGSDELRLFCDHNSLSAFIIKHRFSTPIVLEALLWRCEEFVPGQAASVVILCGPTGIMALRPTTQLIAFADDGRISYQGGAMNLSPAEEARAQKLGLAVAQALPPTNGYIGIDLILGEASDGSEDTVIEVNPRLTTSYLGLRAATEDSLAEAMWRISQGESVNINWLPNVVEFTKQGQVTIRDRS